MLVFANLGHAQVVFYVSLQGNDNWTGQLAERNVGGTDGPFRTFDRAKKAIQFSRSNKKVNGAIRIEIREGTYTMTQGLQLNENHSGTKAQPVIWKNYRNEKVRLIGAQVASEWKPVTDKALRDRLPANCADSIYQVNLKDFAITAETGFQKRGRPGIELFFNDKRMTPARWPDTGWALIADVPQSGELVYKGELPHMRFNMPVGRHYGRFTYREEEPKNWSNPGDILLHGYWVWNWFDEYLQIASIDTILKEITIKPPHSNYGYCKDQRYYALNVLEELNQPGEWYIDRQKGVVLFWPPRNGSAGHLMISQLQDPIIQLENCHDVYIEGLELMYSQGNGILIREGHDIRIAGCALSQLGDIAVRIEGGTHNGIQSCDIRSVALGGVTLSGGNRKTLTSGHNFVINCHIHDIGEWIRTYQSAITISGVGNHIAHNDIHDGPGTGILLTGNEHVIEYNELHDLAKETGDVGAFYMGRDWTERGNIIRYNFFHDLTGPGAHDVNAVYLDDWASGTQVYGNIFSNCARGIMIGGGRDNVVNNNLFVNCRPAIHVDSRGLGWAKYYFDGTNNTLFARMDSMNYSKLPFSRAYPALLKLYKDEPAVAKNNVIIHNISYLGHWMDLYDQLDFKIVHSDSNLVADSEKGPVSKADIVIKGNPGITNYLKQDFRINHSGLKYGYRNIPLSEIGLQKDQFRSQLMKPIQ